MAKIGLKNFRFGILTEAADGTPSYGAGRKPGKAISCNVSITNNTATLFADDVLAESDTSFQSGTVTIGLDDSDLETQAILLGHDYSNGEIVRNSNDVAPYIGLGRIVTKLVGGAKKYRVEFLHKVKFGEPSSEENTKGENVEFGTTEIEGTVSTLANGDWNKGKTFDTYNAAEAYLDSFFYLDKVVTLPTTTSTHAGITYTYDSDNGDYIVTGTSTGASVHPFISAEAIPDTLYAGKRLFVQYTTTNPLVRFRIIWNDANDTRVNADVFTESGYCTVPTGAAKWDVSLSVLEADTSFSPAAVISQFDIYDAPSEG